MYSIVLSQRAKKQLVKLQKNNQIRIISTLERIRIRPFSHVKKLASSPLWSLRVGDYRIIMDVQQKVLLIFVIEVGHRKEVDR